MPSWTLAIDFGTSYTVAAARIEQRAPEVIEIGGERRMPSVVMIDGDGTIVVGRRADDRSASHPDRTLRALKSRLGDQAPVVLAGRPYSAVMLTAAFLRHVHTEAIRHVGSAPDRVLLTHPATWNRPRLDRLIEAAAMAGIVHPVLVPEPIAAALSFAAEMSLPAGGAVAIYDLGGGTFDTAVVTARPDELAIIGRPAGDQHVGGELFDEIVANHLGASLPPDAWDAIQTGSEPLWQQLGATLRNESRKAKEILSGNDYADLILPLPSGLQQSRLLRSTFDDLVRPYVAETVALLSRCVDEAGVPMGSLAGVSLVGGASRSPIIEAMLTHAFPTVPMIRRGDPKTAVAAGATLFRAEQHAPARSTPPSSAQSPSTPRPSTPPPPPPPSGLTPTPMPVPASRARRRWLVAGAVVVICAVIGVVLATRSDGPSDSGPPSPSQMDRALLPVREARLALGSEWDEQDASPDEDLFCQQFDVAEPVRTRDVLFSTLEPGTGINGGDVTAAVKETITAYASAGDAAQRYQQDSQIAEQCATASTSVDGVDYTYTLTNATTEASRAIDADVIALRYDLARVDAPDTIVSAGYVIELRRGDVITSVNGLILGRNAAADDVDAFHRIAAAAFRYADSHLG